MFRHNLIEYGDSNPAYYIVVKEEIDPIKYKPYKIPLYKIPQKVSFEVEESNLIDFD